MTIRSLLLPLVNEPAKNYWGTWMPVCGMSEAKIEKIAVTLSINFSEFSFFKTLRKSPSPLRNVVQAISGRYTPPIHAGIEVPDCSSLSIIVLF